MVPGLQPDKPRDARCGAGWQCDLDAAAEQACVSFVQLPRLCVGYTTHTGQAISTRSTNRSQKPRQRNNVSDWHRDRGCVAFRACFQVPSSTNSVDGTELSSSSAGTAPSPGYSSSHLRPSLAATTHASPPSCSSVPVTIRQLCRQSSTSGAVVTTLRLASLGWRRIVTAVRLARPGGSGRAEHRQTRSGRWHRAQDTRRCRSGGGGRCAPMVASAIICRG